MPTETSTVIPRFMFGPSHCLSGPGVRVSSNIRHTKLTGRPKVVTCPPERCATHQRTLDPTLMDPPFFDVTSQSAVQKFSRITVETGGLLAGSIDPREKRDKTRSGRPEVVAAYRAKVRR